MWKIPQATPSTKALSSVPRYFLWLAGQQKLILTGATVLGIISFLAPAARPYAIGQAIDSGLGNGLTNEIWLWAAVVLGAGLIQVVTGAYGHRLDVLSWLRAALATSRLIGHKVSSAGDAISVELPTGEVVSSVTSDAHRIGDLYFQAARFFGSFATYIVVSYLMFQSSVKLGFVLSIGLPIVAVCLLFLIRPLQKRQEYQREVTGRLTSLGADTVTGLRILRGIGGESVFTARYRDQSRKVENAGISVAKVQANMDGLQTLLPGLFVALFLYLGAHEALTGAITPGQLVTFYGYATFLVWPIQNLIQSVQILTRANVGARRVLKVLAVENNTPDTGSVTSLPSNGVLVDTVSGVRLEPGSFTALVAEDPDVSATIATRMTRFNDAEEADTPVTFAGTLLRDYAKGPLRETIVLSEATPHIFAGTLRDGLVTRGNRSDAEILEALTVADAHDVLTSLPEGLDSELPEKGRSLSGGQRQRVSLARVLLTRAPYLVLIEPTSAVDAHTESRIGAKMVNYRRGGSTLVVTASPLVLEHADHVVVLGEDDRVAGEGTHASLLRETGPVGALYRSIVGRDLDEVNTVETSGTAKEVNA